MQAESEIRGSCPHLAHKTRWWLSRFSGAAASETGIWFPQPLLKFFVFAFFFFFWSSKHWRHQLKAKKNTERQIAWHGYGYGYYSRSRRTPIVKARRDGDACSRLRWFPIQFQFQFGYEHGHGHGYMGIWVWVFASRLDVLIFSYIDNTFFVIVSVLLLLL